MLKRNNDYMQAKKNESREENAYPDQPKVMHPAQGQTSLLHPLIPGKQFEHPGILNISYINRFQNVCQCGN